MTEDELISIMKAEVKDLADEFDDDNDWSNAVAEAVRELGWSLPVTSAFQIRWMKKRAKRHLIDFLLVQAAGDFQYKTIKLQQVFDHLRALVKDWDAEYESSKLDYPDQFLGVDVAATFGYVVDAGFAQEDQTGVDLTYEDDQERIITPSGT